MTSSPPFAKPVLRGWSHAIAAAAAVGATVVLATQTRDDLPRFLSVLVYGISLVLLFATSALYHLGSWSGRWRTILRTADHANIFLVIAGTYTPICVNVLSGWLRPTVLGAVWGAAGLGILFTLATLRLPRWLMAALYVVTGWIALVPGPQLTVLLPAPLCSCSSPAVSCTLPEQLFTCAGGQIQRRAFSDTTRSSTALSSQAAWRFSS